MTEDDTATTAAQDTALGWLAPGWRGGKPHDPRAIDGRISLPRRG